MEVLNKKIKISSPIGLQIGNIVYDNNCDFHRIRANDFSRFNHPNMGGDYGLYAIELSPEILEKCGFEKEQMAYSINIDKFGGGKKLSFSGDYLYIIDSEKRETIPTDIITIWNKDLMKEFYLHQLQNLIFSLTGEELIVNL